MEKSHIKMKVTTISCMEKKLPEDKDLICESGSVTLKNMKHCFILAVANDWKDCICNVDIIPRGELAPYVDIKAIDYVGAPFTLTGHEDDYYLGRSGVYPDVIRSKKKGGYIISPHSNTYFWVSIYNEGGLPVGDNVLYLDVVDANKKLIETAKYELCVLDASKQKADFVKTMWMHYDCICHKHDVQPFTEQFYTIFEKYLKAYTDIGHNALLVPIFTPPLDTYVGGERLTAQLINVIKTDEGYEFDFAQLEKFLDFILARGIEYIEFSHLFTQWGGTNCPKIMASTKEGEKQIFGWQTDSCSKEYEEFLDTLLPQIVKLVKDRGIEYRCRFHITDEPNELHIERYKKCREMVKRNVGDIPTMDALSHYEYYAEGLVDIPVPSVRSVKEFTDKGVESLYAYYCCNPSDEYYSNRLLCMPTQRTRVIGLQLYESGVKGFLHWGYNFYNSGLSYYPIDPYSDSTAGGAFPPGDGYIVYPANDGVNISIRSEAMRMAYDDYDLLYTLEKKIGREKVVSMLNEAGVSGYKQYPHSAKWHEEFICKVKKEIAKK